MRAQNISMWKLYWTQFCASLDDFGPTCLPGLGCLLSEEPWALLRVLPYCLVWPPWIKAGLWCSCDYVCHGRSHSAPMPRPNPNEPFNTLVPSTTSEFRWDTMPHNMGSGFPSGCLEGQWETETPRELADKFISLPCCKRLFQGAVVLFSLSK